MPRRRRFWLSWLIRGLILVIILGFLLHVVQDHTRRCILWGLVRGESFYQGRPTNYWAACILEGEWRRLQPGRPTWFDQTLRLLVKRRDRETEPIKPLMAGNAAAVPVLVELMGHETVMMPLPRI
jgi:hypothetical protein